MSPKITVFAVGAVALGLAACAQTEPEPLPVQPLYDKFGNAECPVGYVLYDDFCVVPAAGGASAGVAGAGGMDGGSMDPGSTAEDPTDPGADPTDVPDDDSGSGNQNRNENQNENQNQNRSDTETRTQNQNG
ncbi:hypothetical protein KUV62_10555 [Salipiger bermudensis]|uniref:hypothetical protein n=1 Tax=Salipiger bermudensis TaxID=344736 RepID=UPI001C99360D|nr:hypothetical protein [Salipiger bermudensis]MBY6004351.1 hypothetical protein [Salipiger bermudensis]